MAKNKFTAKSVLRGTQRNRWWSAKLKHVGLDKFKHVRTFSAGNHAHVSLVQLDGHPDSAFALKIMQKAKKKSHNSRKLVMSEKNILGQAQSEFIVKLYKTFKNKKYLYFLTEYCPGGSLLDHPPTSETAAKFYIACIVEALDCLHPKGICHNDLKPENLVLDAEGYLKVIDFGLAEQLKAGELSYTARGTAAYLAPETVSAWSAVVRKQKPEQGKDRAVDLWALGVIIYEFLAGESPFDDEDGDDKITMKNVSKGISSVRFPKRLFSPTVVDLITKLCAYEPSERLGYRNVEEIRKHRWFRNFDWDSLRQRNLEPPVLPKVTSAVDTLNFSDDIKITSDSEVIEDESDWDIDF